ncbi:HPP family protein [Thiobacillus sp.]|uniref:HPP family protein n=1 Tax=Thiobacillus sp. TaxID=924 RepID=UPI0025D6311A|nr:HPP family protein [Thiobacillus sp.]MBT9539693.1 HPP family protein [Thiobacillus sp.]
MRNLLSRLFPQQATVSHRERVLSGLGGILAIFLTTLIAQRYIGGVTLPFMLASMGASTVLLLGAPHSPLSQPWAFAGGHLVSSFVGISCATTIPNVYLAAGLAVGLSISAMYYLRCLHPPGGATALLTVIGDQKIHMLGFHFMLMPVLVNVVVLLGVALIINNLIPGRRYPANIVLHSKTEAHHGDETPSPVKLSFDQEDLRTALREMDGYIDVSGEDLTRIYGLATLHAHQRGFGGMSLGDIMTHDVVTTKADTDLRALWAQMKKHGIRGVPVLGQDGRVVGMVTIVDFLNAVDWRICESFIHRLKDAFKRKSPSTAERIMSAPVITARVDTPLTEAFLTFSEHGINHLPVIETDGRLIGIVTRLDLLSALYGDRVGQQAK